MKAWEVVAHVHEDGFLVCTDCADLRDVATQRLAPVFVDSASESLEDAACDSCNCAWDDEAGEFVPG